MLQMLFMMLQESLFFLGYVTGKSEFPQPLSRAEETEYKARQELITHNLRLVSRIARKYQVPNYGQDDLIAIGGIGPIEAVNSFKATAGTSLRTILSLHHRDKRGMTTAAAGVEGFLGDGENRGWTSMVRVAGGVAVRRGIQEW